MGKEPPSTNMRDGGSVTRVCRVAAWSQTSVKKNHQGQNAALGKRMDGERFPINLSITWSARASSSSSSPVAIMDDSATPPRQSRSAQMSDSPLLLHRLPFKAAEKDLPLMTEPFREMPSLSFICASLGRWCQDS